jgi:GNAT superfamily N-acetyltransferase
MGVSHDHANVNHSDAGTSTCRHPRTAADLGRGVDQAATAGATMVTVNHADTYTANAARMWSSLAPTIAVPDGVLGTTTPDGDRYVLIHPLAQEAVAALLDALPYGRRAVVEDSYGVVPVPIPGGMTALRMPVMNRVPGRVVRASRPGVTVAAVADADTAHAERVIVDGFPRRHLQPWMPGRALPPQVLDLPGWRVWLACRDGAPAAAGYTYDDGAAVGVYWLATLPEYRGCGLGRAVTTAMLAAYPARTATLVATEAGVPLYTSLGFAAVSTATWYVPAR